MFTSSRTIDRPAIVENLSRRLNKLHDRQLKANDSKARQVAPRNLPRDEQEARTMHSAVRAPYAAFAHEVDELLQPKVDCPAGEVQTQLAQSATALYDQKIAAKEKEKEIAEIDANQELGPISPPLAAFVAVLITSAAFMGEAIWASDGFQITGASPKEARIVALSYAIAMAGMLHVTVFIIQRLRRRIWKIITAIIALAIATVVFWVVGTLRARFLQLSEDTQDLSVEPWMFAVVSLAIFLGLGALSLLFMPSWDQITAWWRKRKARQLVKRIEREIAKLEAERKAVAENLAASVEQSARVVDSARSLKNRSRELHKEAHARFVHEVVLRRTVAPPAEFMEAPQELFTEHHQ